ncbi:MAG: PQQ-binding-like beta-propeller repeat protein [Planctomycetota bacterium]
MTLALAALALAGGPSAAQEPPEPLSAWARRGPAPDLSSAELPTPLATELPFEDPFAPWRAGTPAEAQAFADAVVQVLESPRGASVLPLRPGVSRVGARSQARRWLGRLPAAWVEGVSARLGPAPRPSVGSEVQALRAWSDAKRPDERRQRGEVLGEVLFERGDVSGALLVWRAALAEGAGGLARRVAYLRALLPSRLAGSSQGPAPLAPRPRRVAWARRAPGGDVHEPRAMAAHGGRVYYVDSQGVVAVRLEDGLLVWRSQFQGDPRGELIAGDHVVLLRQADRLIGLRAADGATQWTVEAAASREERFVRAQAIPQGYAVLVESEGRRLLRAYNQAGGLVWSTRLWATPVGGAWVAWLAPAVVPLGQGPADEGPLRGHPEAFSVLPVPGPPRQVVEDGQLAALGDRLFLTWDGVLAAFDLYSGELLWQQERYLGREVKGDRVRVGLGVGPYALNAVTATGMLVRLDPLDGRQLALPRPPEGTSLAGTVFDLSTPEAARPYVLTLAPLCLLYEQSLGYEVRVGVEGELLTRLALGPLGPGAVRGGELLVPDGEGLVGFDLGAGGELSLVPWPGQAGATQVLGGGATLFSGPTVVARFAQGEPGSEDPPRLADDLAGLVAQLGAEDWHVRLRAQEAVEALGEEGREVLEELVHVGRTPDVRDQARLALRRLELEAAFRELIPSGQEALLRQVLDGVDMVDALEAMLPHVTPRSGGSRRLVRLTLATPDPLLQQAYVELLVLVDGHLRERLLARLLDPKQGLALRQGCAQLLAVYAERSQDAALLRRACAGDPRARGWRWPPRARAGWPSAARPDTARARAARAAQRGARRAGAGRHARAGAAGAPGRAGPDPGGQMKAGSCGVAALALIAGAAVGQDFEPNQSRRQAARIQPGTYGDLVCDGEDWYVLELGPGQRLVAGIAFVHASGDLDLACYDARGRLCALARSTAEREVVSLIPEREGPVFVRVYGEANRYELSLQAANLGSMPATGWRYRSAGNDWVVREVPAGEALRCAATSGNEQPLEVVLRDQDGNELAAGEVGARSEASFGDGGARRVLAQVRGAAGVELALTVEVGRPVPEDLSRVLGQARPEGAGNDAVELQNGDVIHGEVLTPGFRITTAYGELSLGRAHVAGIDLGTPSREPQRLGAVDGSRFSGFLREDTLTVKLEGEPLEVPLARVRRVLFGRRGEECAGLRSRRMLVLENGDGFSCALDGVDGEGAERWGVDLGFARRQVNLDTLQGIEVLSADEVRLNGVDGSSLRGRLDREVVEAELDLPAQDGSLQRLRVHLARVDQILPRATAGVGGSDLEFTFDGGDLEGWEGLNDGSTSWTRVAEGEGGCLHVGGANGGNYADNAAVSATSPVLPIEGMESPILSYRARYQLEDGADFVVVLASYDEGPYVELHRFTGTQPYTPLQLPLERCAGVRIRFVLVSDASVNAPGAWIDDVKVQDGAE